ncbi:MAG: hypothetical protein IPJ14_08890 [Kineosporiaceae bacterium]|nr:hypothetical protein [Kineosporiaceae bacterium]MBK7622767.1 hypothetical protein [Kineosporiaceae bacterium]MBK8078743.1 hypothetical protein [Kineosporiaceae bacterium]
MSKQETIQNEVAAWFTQRLPEEWVAPANQVTVDREEITVVLGLAGPDAAAEATEAERAQALAGYVARWRADTRERRIAIAREAEHRFGRKLAWGVRVGEHSEVFTHLAVPVMTRLRQSERQVLDTLVDAGVARSRAHALAWCVRLVGRNTESWLADLRQAMEKVAEVREAGPASS